MPEAATPYIGSIPRTVESAAEHATRLRKIGEGMSDRVRDLAEKAIALNREYMKKLWAYYEWSNARHLAEIDQAASTMGPGDATLLRASLAELRERRAESCDFDLQTGHFRFER